MTESVITSDDLDADIARYLDNGYRLDMIRPADSPQEALLTNHGNTVRLRSGDRPTSTKEWIKGRAGMMYRDLIPDRLGGKVIASHIRLTNDGEVPDYVHYHKVGFQMIYCLRGRIRVVYEDQGPPFWLATGDCVLQPPQIRHRVLESSGLAEVLEITSPAEHETWVDHELNLPTSRLDSNRDFGGQRFVRHVAAEAAWAQQPSQSVEQCDLGIAAGSNKTVQVDEIRSTSPAQFELFAPRNQTLFLYSLEGEAAITESRRERTISRHDTLVVSGSEPTLLNVQPGFRALRIQCTCRIVR